MPQQTGTSSHPVKFPITTNLVSLILTAVLAIGGAAITVYTGQATNSAKTEAVQQRVDKLEQKQVTREELSAELKAMQEQLRAISEQLKYLREDLRSGK